jgi:hypothetical protein
MVDVSLPDEITQKILWVKLVPFKRISANVPDF